MKLLIITQVVDSEHPILGFFHRWIEEFAKNCDEVTVFALEVGTYSFPQNVTVYSLGKESGKGRLTYLFRFYTLIWKHRHTYSDVFVHMNQMYVLLGAPIWSLFKKRIILWYMHGSVSSSLRWAEKWADKICTGSAESFQLSSKKLVITGHGIDTTRFTPPTIPKNIDLITVGRITESKNLTTAVAVLEKVRQTHEVSLTIIGVAITEAEKQYEAGLRAFISDKGLTSSVHFIGRVSQADLPQYLNQAKVFIHTATNGSLDKAILEAMACGIAVVSMAPSSASLPLGAAATNSLDTTVAEVKKVLESGVVERTDYVNYVRKEHSLSSLIPNILQ